MGPARVPSRFEIVNALAWILARAEELRAGGRDSLHALDQALQEHEAILVEYYEQRASEGDPRVGPGAVVDAVDEILVRASALYESGREPGDAITRAMREHGARDNLARIAVAAWAITCQGGGELIGDTSEAASRGRA